MDREESQVISMGSRRCRLLTELLYLHFFQFLLHSEKEGLALTHILPAENSEDGSLWPALSLVLSESMINDFEVT